MKQTEKVLGIIKKNMALCEKNLAKVESELAFQCGFELIQQIKKPILELIDSNVRNQEIIETCENLVELLIRSGSISFREKPSETVQLSAILNYCCFLLEEFNLRKEVSDYLYDIYNEWYSIEEG